MSDARSNQAVAERLDINIERWPNPLFRRRRWLTLLAGLAAVLFVGVYAARHDRTIYHARPVSTGHQLWSNDCGKCHSTAWQPLVRLTTLDNSVRSVRDQDCRQCHVERSNDHHRVASAASYPDCAACHKEHQGRERLAEVADRFCLACHLDLKAQHPSQSSFVNAIDSFEHHPRFAIHRRWKEDPRTAAVVPDDYPGEAHHAWRNVEVEQRDREWLSADKAQLKFSHNKHLKRHLQRVPGQPVDEMEPDEFRKLDCSDCHQPDAAGHYMRPIVYEDHCASCHPLKYSGKLLGADNESLPHENVEVVHGVLRDRLMAFARRAPDKVPDSDPTTPRLPNERPEARDVWAFVEEELRLIETTVFQVPKEGDFQQPEQGRALRNNACQKCHLVESMTNAASPPALPSFKVVPPQIPQRWLRHSRFRHDRHRGLTCVHCHHKQSASSEILQGQPAAITLESETVKDVLMPSIQICQDCHGGQRKASPAVRARSSCVECHQYHHEDSRATVGRSLNEILPAEGGGDNTLAK